MPYITKRNTWRAFLILVMIAPFILLSSPLRPWISGGGLGTLFGEITYPLEFLVDLAFKKIDHTKTRYLTLSEAERENEILRDHLQKMQTRILDYENQVQESKRLRDLLGFAKHYRREYLAAEIVGRSNHSTFRSIRTSRGKKEGIQVGMPVLSNLGIVGRVIRTGQYFSDIQLFGDRNFYIDALLERSRLRTVLHGISERKMQFNLGQRADVRIGDSVITSGITGSFPKGLPIGKVIKIQYETDHVSQVITIEPFVDIRSLEEVIILLRKDDSIRKIREVAGDRWLHDSVKALEKG